MDVECGIGLFGPHFEKLKSRVLIGRDTATILWVRHAGHVEDPFALQIEPFPRCHQQLEVRRLFQHFRDQSGFINQVFKVIHDEQEVFLAQVVEHLVFRIEITRMGIEGEVEGVGDRGSDVFGRI